MTYDEFVDLVTQAQVPSINVFPEAPILNPSNRQTFSDSTIMALKDTYIGNPIGIHNAMTEDAIRQGIVTAPVGNNPRGTTEFIGTWSTTSQKLMQFVNKYGDIIIFGAIGYAIISGLSGGRR